MKSIWLSACLAFVAGAAVAEPLITEERVSRTKSGIDSLSPDQRSKFDTEKSRLLAEIGRGPDGKLIAAPIDEKAAEARPAKKSKQAKAKKARKAKKLDAKRAAAPAPAKSDIGVVGAPIREDVKPLPVQY